MSTACAVITLRALHCRRSSGNARSHRADAVAASLCRGALAVLLRPARRHSAVATPSCLRVVFSVDRTSKPLKPVYRLMGDPRNVAHAKKVTQEKHHNAKHSQTTRAPQSGKKAQIDETKSAATEQSTAPKPEAEKPAQPPDSNKLEKSLAVLSNLKDLEFHSRSNIKS